MVRAVLAIVVWVCGSAALAQDRDAAAAFTVNTARHVLLHEIGHLLVDQFNLPVLGREEDAVDTLATLLVLDREGADARAILGDTLDGWLHSERDRPQRGYSNADYYGMHSLDIQRSYAIACMMVGSDYEGYTRFATRVGLPIGRQETCAEDYRVAQHGWNAVLNPHRRTAAPARSTISFDYDAEVGAYAPAAKILREGNVLEEAAAWLTKSFNLPHSVHLTAELCGEPNAFYVPDANEVILCYEWADHFHQLFVDSIAPVRAHFARIRALKLDKLGQ